jgi:signal transduction histidine kinase
VDQVAPLVSASGLLHPVFQALRNRSTAALPADVVLLARNGAEVAIAGSASYLQDEQGGGGAILIFRDVGGERRAESQMRYAQKLESLGIMAGGLAHDFNNLLTPIIGFSSLLKAGLADNSNLQPMVQQIEIAAHRAADLVRQMLAYAGKARSARSPLRLQDLLEEMRPALEKDLSAHAALQFTLAPQPPIEADAEQMRQILIALVANASEALLGRPGVVEIRTGALNARSSDLQSPYLHQDLPAGRYAWIEVRDTGCGIPAEVLGKVFDPFFTTKFTRNRPTWTDPNAAARRRAAPAIARAPFSSSRTRAPFATSPPRPLPRKGMLASPPPPGRKPSTALPRSFPASSASCWT